MKRLLGLFLALLLLAGCAADTPKPTAPSTETMPQATGPNQQDLYDPVAEATNGAVHAHSLGAVDCVGIAAIEEDILLLTMEPGVFLSRIDGSSGAVTAKVSLAGDISLYGGAFQVTDKRISYYEGSSGDVVFLDGQLAETSRVELPEGLLGYPVLPPDMSTIYYCTGQEIRAMDMQTGISRLVMRSTVPLTLLQSCFDGQILACLAAAADGESETWFISAKDGEILGKDASLLDLETYEDAFFLRRTDGIITERLLGTVEGDIYSLNLPEDATVIPAMAMGGILTVSGQEHLELSFYDLSSGRRTAAVTIPDTQTPYAYGAGQEAIWFLSCDASSEESILYRWDVAKSPAEDKTVYTGPRYTAESPDVDGLAACQAQADAIGETYGVKILTGSAAAEQPCDYELESEYQVAAYQKSLPVLERVLARYPEGFFDSICQGTDSGVLHIGLVRSISGERAGVQYWPNGDAYLVLAVGGTMERTFYHELSYVLDAYIIANSLAYDEWESLNPDGFTYDYSYDFYMERDSMAYLEGETRAFVDSYAMTYPREDRAGILEYAMTEGYEQIFQAEILQQKLRQICIAIRDAFDLEEDPTVFPWEQYLQEPLAYTAS